LALLVGYAFVMTFYWASTAIERWQFVAVIFVFILVLAKGFSRYFYCSNKIVLSAFLPSTKLMWQGKAYTLLPSCRYGFIGFWLALTPTSSIENEKVYFFIPRFMLSSADISFLSFLICASDNNAVSDISS
jgi:hypothetical protein